MEETAPMRLALAGRVGTDHGVASPNLTPSIAALGVSIRGWETATVIR